MLYYCYIFRWHIQPTMIIDTPFRAYYIIQQALFYSGRQTTFWLHSARRSDGTTPFINFSRATTSANDVVILDIQ